MKGNVLLLVLLLASAIVLFGCTQGNGGGAPPAGNETITPPANKTIVSGEGLEVRVEIKDFKFIPETISIKKGTKVTWTNFDTAPHTATSEGKFDSGVLQKGESWSKVFDETGAYDYICTIHPKMTGKVEVS